jgi:hypothetical protein
MHSRVLIDQIMQQTTILIAQLSTAAGIRAPLAHIADEVFLHLSDSIEKQGVSRKVAADMFGMALRTYQRRVQAITESTSVRDRTLWEAVFEYIHNPTGRTRDDVLHRFRWDGDSGVKAVLHDLINSGLIYSIKQAGTTLYKVTPESDLKTLAEHGERSSLASLIWVHVYRQGEINIAELSQHLKTQEELVQQVVAELVGEGRLEEVTTDEDDVKVYRSMDCYLPVGDQVGWGAAVYDHFQAMAKAIAHKLNSHGARSAQDDQIGGATLSFDIYPGHPQEDEVLSLLKRYRAEINELWSRVVETTNEARSQGEEPPADAFKVTFYMGQNIEES